MMSQALIDHGRLLEVLGLEAEYLPVAAHAGGFGTAVPTCPGWTIGEVVRHVGSIYRVALGWIREERRPDEWQREPAEGQSAEEYLRGGLAELVGELGAHDPDEYAATWWPDDLTYGFWTRRMAHDTTIHRADVEAAYGPISEIAEDVAVDGIDEVLRLWFGRRLPMLGLSGTREGTVGVRAGGHSWVARAGPSETVAWRSSAEEANRASAVVSGDPMQVYLWLWGRASPAAITIEGDDMDSVGQLWALLRLATR